MVDRLYQKQYLPATSSMYYCGQCGRMHYQDKGKVFYTHLEMKQDFSPY